MPGIAEFLQQLLGGGQQIMQRPPSLPSGIDPYSPEGMGNPQVQAELMRAMQGGQPQQAPQAAPQPQGGPMPQQMPQAAAQPQGGPMAPQGQPMPPRAPMPAPGPSGGGLLGSLFGPSRAENETHAWLVRKGYDPAAASMIIKNKPMLQKVIYEHGSPASPMDALNAEKARIDIEKGRRDLNEKPKRDTAIVNGKVVYLDNGQVLGDYGQEVPDSVRALDERARRAGILPGSPEYNDLMIKGGAGGDTFNIGGEGDKFYENLDKKNAETFSALSDTGIAARSKIAQIGRLEEIMATAPHGALAMLKQAAGEWGIKTEGVDELQAATALINKMVPEQREPGSGPMSDRDIELFRASLPRVLNQPGGNKIIFQTLRGIAQYEMQMGEIADKVADREITPQEGRAAIRALANPLKDFGKLAAGGGNVLPGRVEVPTMPLGGNGPSAERFEGTPAPSMDGVTDWRDWIKRPR